MKYLFIVAISLVLSACSFKQGVQINHYALSNGYKTIKSEQTFDKTLLLHFPKVNQSFNTQQIIYSTQVHHFESYAKNQWLQLPSTMLYTIIQQAFQEHALFKHTTTNAFVQHDYAMHTQLLTLYHGYDKNLEHSYAFVEIKFDVVQNKQLLETLYFKQKVLCEENTPYGFILASNQAFETIFKTLFQKLPPLIEP